MKIPELDDCLKKGKIVRFPAAKTLREGADYENTFDPESAKALVDQAEEFVKIAAEVVLGE